MTRPNWIKRRIRHFAVWLRSTTDKWVVPSAVYALVNEGKADAALTLCERTWPGDPEVVYAWTLNDFCKGDEYDPTH